MNDSGNQSSQLARLDPENAAERCAAHLSVRVVSRFHGG